MIGSKEAPRSEASAARRPIGAGAWLTVAAAAVLVAASCSPAVTPPATVNAALGSPSPTATFPTSEATPSGTPSLTPSLGPVPSARPSATPKPQATPEAVADPYPRGVLIADRGNGRLIILNASRRIVWQFPVAGSFASPTPFNADDAFFTPDGKSITANDEGRHVIYKIDLATRKVVWSYGHLGVKGSAPGYLNTPDDAYGLPNGDIVVADINNCRILEITPAKQIARQWGRTGVCRDAAPATFGYPNGDTPLPDGGLLVTQIHDSRVDRLSASGQLLWEIHVPITYPSDAQLDSNGNVIVAGFTNPGAVACVTPHGVVLWRYAPTSGSGRLDHPSLAIPLGNGLISINDDDRNRLIVLDSRTMRIVWQYGVTDRASSAAGSLSDPDGHEPVPANVVLP